MAVTGRVRYPGNQHFLVDPSIESNEESEQHSRGKHAGLAPANTGALQARFSESSLAGRNYASQIRELSDFQLLQMSNEHPETPIDEQSKEYQEFQENELQQFHGNQIQEMQKEREIQNPQKMQKEQELQKNQEIQKPKKQEKGKKEKMADPFSLASWIIFILIVILIAFCVYYSIGQSISSRDD